MPEKFTRWDVTDDLRTKEDVRLYLEACAEEDPGDGSLIRAALNDIARSHNMSHLAREVGMTREGLYKALGENGNPTFATVLKITRAGDAGTHHCMTGESSIASTTARNREQSPVCAPSSPRRAIRASGCRSRRRGLTSQG